MITMWITSDRLVWLCFFKKWYLLKYSDDWRSPIVDQFRIVGKRNLFQFEWNVDGVDVVVVGSWDDCDCSGETVFMMFFYLSFVIG